MSRSRSLSRQYIAHARTVLALAPDLVDEVKTGETSLADAYKTAQERKKAKERKEQGLKQLRQIAPDLADRVEDDADKLTLPEARAILNDPDKEH